MAHVVGSGQPPAEELEADEDLAAVVWQEGVVLGADIGPAIGEVAAAVAASDVVSSGEPVQRVGALTTMHLVGVAAAFEVVVLLAALEEVVAIQATDGVVATQASDPVGTVGAIDDAACVPAWILEQGAPCRHVLVDLLAIAGRTDG